MLEIAKNNRKHRLISVFMLHMSFNVNHIKLCYRRPIDHYAKNLASVSHGEINGIHRERKKINQQKISLRVRSEYGSRKQTCIHTPKDLYLDIKHVDIVYMLIAYIVTSNFISKQRLFCIVSYEHVTASFRINFSWQFEHCRVDAQLMPIIQIFSQHCTMYIVVKRIDHWWCDENGQRY